MASTEFDLIIAYLVFWAIALVFAASIFLQIRKLAKKIGSLDKVGNEAE